MKKKEYKKATGREIKQRRTQTTDDEKREKHDREL
jgi:hypothetical protein